MNTNYNLTRGQELKIETVNEHSRIGVFKDIVIIAQVLPAIVLEVKKALRDSSKEVKTILIPVQSIVSIELPESSILVPTISETKEAHFSKL